MNIQINFDKHWQADLLNRIESDGPWANPTLYHLAYQIQKRQTIESFSGLIAPKYLPKLHLLPHQVQTAQTVIEEMNGTAILADEVGLGKTIEAGLILKEYMIRGIVKKALILTPASLVNQWYGELRTKFHIQATPHQKKLELEHYDVLIMSIDAGKREPYKSQLLKLDYDIIIVDEAHKLKNPKTKNYEFVKALKKKFCLLLTATPIQNKLSEVFYLVSLLKPGHLGSESSFNHDFKKNKHELKNEHELKQLIQKVMVRNRRNDMENEWPKRIVDVHFVDLTDQEKKIYHQLEQCGSIDLPIDPSSLSLLTLKREFLSSKEALYFTLGNLHQKFPHLFKHDHFMQLTKDIGEMSEHSKAKKALEIIQSIDDKVIIFTEYRMTQLYLQWYLQKHGISSVPFRGGFKRSKKDWMRQLFAGNTKVLIATEAGGEGINLQFCHHLINYDLPWNPMRLEQRIGRIHRLGQEHDVYIYHLVTKQTIEEQIYHLLYKKIDLFEKVIGQLDDILLRLNLPSFDDQLDDIFNHSIHDGEMRIKLENLQSFIENQVYG